MLLQIISGSREIFRDLAKMFLVPAGTMPNMASGEIGINL